ncbi:MAG: hypothetical protein ABJG41_03440 [Cyclobacteriaceae bacterium]
MMLVSVPFSCTKTLDIDARHKSVLQVDAVFYADEPLPIIEIKQSFESTGTQIYEIPYSEILVGGASVELKRNGEVLAVSEESKGVYKGVSDDTVRMGDVFEIEVIHEGRLVTSRAVVPDFPIENISFSEEEVATFELLEALTRDSIPDTVALFTGEPQVKAVVPFIPEFMAFEYYSVDDEKAEEIYQLRYLGEVNGFYGYGEGYLKKNFVGLDSLILYRDLFSYFPEDERPPENTHVLNVGFDIVIAEAIYGEFHNRTSGTIVPITVTNIEGGVGLFFGAIRKTGFRQVPVHFDIP